MSVEQAVWQPMCEGCKPERQVLLSLGPYAHPCHRCGTSVTTAIRVVRS